MGNPVHSPFAALHAYELRHLPAHLVDSGQGNTLHRLLALEVPEGHNAWYARKHANGDVSGFLADINLGWRIAEQSSRESIYLTRAASHIALELRYALILASINSVSSSLPPSLLGPLVAASAWPVEQALTFARRYVDWSKRVRALACLAPSLAAAGRTDDLREAIAQTLGPAGQYRSRAHHSIYSPDEEDQQTATPDEYQKKQAIAAIAPYLPAELLDDAIAAAQSINVSYFRVEALSALVPFLTPTQRARILRQTLYEIHRIPVHLYRAEALAGIAPYLSRRAKTAALRKSFAAEEQAVKQTDNIPPDLQAKDGRLTVKPHAAHVAERCAVFDTLAPQLSEPLVREALSAAEHTDPGDARRYAMQAAFLPQLAALGFVTEAEQAANKIPLLFFRAPAVVRIALHMEERSRHDRCYEMYEQTTAIPRADHRAQVLTWLIPHLPTGLMPEAVSAAIQAARKVKSDYFQARILAGLVPGIVASPEPFNVGLLRKATKAAITIEDEDYRDEALAALANHLTAEQLLHLVETHQPSRTQDAIDQLRTNLLSAQRNEQTFRQSRNRQHSRKPTLSTDIANITLHTIGKKLGRGEDCAQSLIAVSPSLPDEVVSPARAIADEIVSDYWRQRALAALAMLPTAPGYPDALIEPLTLALDLRNQEETAIEIRRLAPYLPDLPAETVHRLWSVALHKLAHDDRYFLLQHLTACAPVIMLLGRDQAVKQSELAASDASRWWGNPRETISQRSEENSPPDEVYSETVIAEDEPPSTRISYHAMVSLATYLTDDGHLDACWRCLITSKEVPWKQAAILMWSQAIHQGRRMQVWPSDWYTPIVKADSLTKPTGPVRKYDNFTSSIRPTTI